jgi:hypothetical protein
MKYLRRSASAALRSRGGYSSQAVVSEVTEGGELRLFVVPLSYVVSGRRSPDLC